MESIWFYDFAFCPFLIIHDMTSVNWTLYANEIGTFELHTVVEDKVTEVLKEHPYLVAVQGDKQAIVTGWQLGEECIIYGRTCNWLLTRRITQACDQLSDTAENITRSLVAAAFADTEEMVLGEQTEAGDTVTYEQNRDKTTFEAVQSCLELSKAGHSILFDVEAKCWVYQVTYGQKLSLLLAEDNRNIYDSAYTETFLDYYNGGWFYEEQAEDGAGHRPEPVRTYCGGEEEAAGIFRWECMLEATTPLEAAQELAKQGKSRKASAKMRTLTFGKDYHLGDYIDLKVEKGGFSLTEEKQITGVHIWYESESCGEEPIFN